MTALETVLLARFHTDRKVKAAGARLGMARRWAELHPDRWPPEKIRELECELEAARDELTKVKAGTAA